MGSYVCDVNSEPSRRGARSLPALKWQGDYVFPCFCSFPAEKMQGDYAPRGKMADSWYYSAGFSAE